MELFAALLCAVRPFSGSPFPRPLVFIELVTGFVVWSAFAFVELGCFVRPVRAFVLSELPLLVTRSSPKKYGLGQQLDICVQQRDRTIAREMICHPTWFMDRANQAAEKRP